MLQNVLQIRIKTSKKLVMSSTRMPVRPKVGPDMSVEKIEI